MRCSIGEVRRSAFQVAFEMTVGDRVAAEGYGWLVGFDYRRPGVGAAAGRAAERAA